MIVRIFIILILSTAPLFSQTVFLKDGSLLRGKIRDLPKENSVKVTSIGKEKIVSRKNILRISYNDDYKKQQYLYLKDNTSRPCYVVQENFEKYTCRKVLKSSSEFTVLKKNVRFISRKKMYFEKGKPFSQVKPPVASTREHALFLKNGRIIEGTILKDSGKEVVIRDKNKKTLTFKHKELSRVTYSNSYKNPVFFYYYNNIDEKVFVVEETKKTWKIRNKLNMACEREVLKKDVNIVSSSKIPIDYTKYEYADINIFLMYVPMDNESGWEHTIVTGITWVDPMAYLTFGINFY